MSHTLLKFPYGNPDTETMREMARNANVSFDETPIRYEGGYVGYENHLPDQAPDTALEAVQDAFENNTGVRPEQVEYTPPEPRDTE